MKPSRLIFIRTNLAPMIDTLFAQLHVQFILKRNYAKKFQVISSNSFEYYSYDSHVVH